LFDCIKLLRTGSNMILGLADDVCVNPTLLNELVEKSMCVNATVPDYCNHQSIHHICCDIVFHSVLCLRVFSV